jgi:glycosyltransferase involved in cell wall biosynthesis
LIVDIAIHLFEPSDGGLDRVAILLANGFRARGFSTELWLARAEGPNARLIAPDLPVRIVPAPSGKRGWALAAQMPALRHAVRKHRPKVLLSAGNQGNLPVALARLGTKTASIAKITNPVARPGAQGIGQRARDWRFGKQAQLADLTLALSAADARQYAADYPKARFAFVHNPYVEPAHLALAATRRAMPAEPMLLSVGRLAVQKDQAMLLDALARLKNRPWRLTLVGNGPLRGDLERQAARLGLASRITFAGFVDPLPHFAAADLFVLPSRWEGLPAVALEALAAGLPVVATDCAPGLTELLAALKLPATPVGDATAFAQAIKRVLDNPSDPISLSNAAAPWGMDAAIEDHLRLMQPWLDQTKL